MPRKSPNPTSVPSLEGGTLISLEQNLLPKSIITRLAKSAIPEGSMVQKDAQLALAKSSTVFVNRLIDEANEKARLAGKKTIVPKDVFDALKEMELEEFTPILEGALEKFNARAALKRSASKPANGANSEQPTVDSDERPSKKIRTDADGTSTPSGTGSGAPTEPTTDAADELNDSELDTGDELEDGAEDEEEDDEEEPHIINDTREVLDVEGDLEEVEGEGQDEGGDEALDNGEDSD